MRQRQSDRPDFAVTPRLDSGQIPNGGIDHEHFGFAPRRLEPAFEDGGPGIGVKPGAQRQRERKAEGHGAPSVVHPLAAHCVRVNRLS